MENKKSGFTLIELSIVLVIIGLVVGGVLVGKDMIKNAEVRSAAVQIDGYKTAVNIFKGKYNTLPGDMSPAKAAKFNLFTLTGCGGCPFDDGAIIDEGLVFWLHLFQAGLLPETMNSSLLDPDNGSFIGTTDRLGEVYPKAKLFEDYWTVYYEYGGPVAFGKSIGNGFMTLNNSGTEAGNTPFNAYALDSKLDDGKPTTGSVIEAGYNWAAIASEGMCVYGGASENDEASRYNTNPTTGGNLGGGACTQIIDAGF